jgi:EamA domain-containing membrane protein RarD
MTVPMWKARTLLHKSPGHFADVFATKYGEAAEAEPVPMSEIGILHYITPTVRVVYQRTKVKNKN